MVIISIIVPQNVDGCFAPVKWATTPDEWYYRARC